MDFQTLGGIVVRSTSTTEGKKQVNIQAFYYWLRSFIDKTYPENTYKWFPNIYDWDSVDDVVNTILSRNPDILLVSMAIWNQAEHQKICNMVREKSNKIKIVIGGPEINAKDIQSNFERFSFADCIIYGDGEAAFLEMVKRYEKDSFFSAGLNCAIRGENGYYKRFRYEDYEPYPVYSGHLFDEFLRDNDYLRSKYKSLVEWPYETNRGCPYACSFCDWSSGLHHKVSMRDEDMIFAELKKMNPVENRMILRANDANFGMPPRDENILDFFYDYTVPIRIPYWTKTKKPMLYQKWLKYEKLRNILMKEHNINVEPNVVISLQSLKKETLEAIHRPELDWDKHKKLILDFEEKRINKEDEMRIDFIQDLPLMTFYDYVFQLFEAADLGVTTLNFYPWDYLPNSPANDSKYREKYNLKTVDTIFVRENIKIDNLKNLLNHTDHTNSYETKLLHNKNIDDVRIFINIIYEYYNIDPKNFIKNISRNIGKLYALSLKIKSIVEKQEKVVGKHVWGVYQEKDKTIYPFSLYFGWFFSQDILNRIKQENFNFPDRERVNNLLNISTQPPRPPVE